MRKYFLGARPVQSKNLKIYFLGPFTRCWGTRSGTQRWTNCFTRWWKRTLRGAHIHARLNTGDRLAICRSAKRWPLVIPLGQDSREWWLSTHKVWQSSVWTGGSVKRSLPEWWGQWGVWWRCQELTCGQWWRWGNVPQTSTFGPAKFGSSEWKP